MGLMILAETNVGSAGVQPARVNSNACTVELPMG